MPPSVVRVCGTSSKAASQQPRIQECRWHTPKHSRPAAAALPHTAAFRPPPAAAPASSHPATTHVRLLQHLLHRLAPPHRHRPLALAGQQLAVVAANARAGAVGALGRGTAAGGEQPACTELLAWLPPLCGPPPCPPAFGHCPPTLSQARTNPQNSSNSDYALTAHSPPATGWGRGRSTPGRTCAPPPSCGHRRCRCAPRR